MKKNKTTKQSRSFASAKRKFMMLCLAVTLGVVAYAQRPIKGNVKDEFGEPLIGVNVSIKGTAQGTITDADGNYSISAKEKDVLVFSFMGMEQQNITIGKQSVFDIVMKDDSKLLSEVVVTALGIKREEKALGYSVQKVSGESLQKVAGTELATALTGKVAGLLVKNSSDFATAPNLTIRGEEPLLVIDGVAYANKKLSDISSEDIESMSVLKGATASALYGFRGASGAILITTKNGSGNKTGVTVDLATNTMFTAGFLAIPEKQSIFGRGSDNVYDKDSWQSWGERMDGRIINQWDPFKKEYRDYEYLPIGKNNFKNFLEQGFVTNNNVNVAYNTGTSSLRSSLNWTHTKGQYPNQKLDKFSYTLGGDVNIDKFKLSSNMSYSKRMSPNMGSNGYTSYDPMYTLLVRSSADYNVLDYKNNYWLKEGEVQNFTYREEQNNPYFDAYERTNQFSRDIFNADLTASYDLTGWLKATVRSGLDYYMDRGVQKVSKGSYVSTGRTPIPGLEDTWNGTLVGAYNVGQQQGFSMNNDLLLTGERALGKLNIEYLAGGTLFYTKSTDMLGMTQGGISVPGFFSLNASVNPARVEEKVVGRQVNSIYGRVAFSWDRMLYVDVTGRNDWSSTQVSTKTPSYFYPSVSSSFVISELMPETKEWLDLLKVRGSWTVSKKPAAVYATNSVYTINSATWDKYNGASAPSYLYSSDIRPETASTFEVGLQGMAFKNRLMVDVAYYNKRTFDLLKEGRDAAPISEASGYTKIVINTDEERSRRGWEITLNGTPLKNKEWQWDLGVNWSKYGTYYVKLDDLYTEKKPWIKAGERVDAYVSKDFQYDKKGNSIWENGRLLPSKYDSRFGWKDPDFVWGINSTLRYKDFTLYMSFDGVVGGLMNTRTESYMWQTGIHPKSATDAREKPYIGQGVKVISGEATYDQFGNITSDSRVFAANDVSTTYQQYIIDLHGSSAWGGNGTRPDTYSKTFFKFRELSLTYNLPQSFLSKVYLKGASVSFVGQNLLLWAKDFKYSDPDGGKEDFADPSVRYLGGNIKFTF